MLHKSLRSDAPIALPPQALLASALESAANAIFITDEEGHIVWVNQSFSRLCGYAPQDLLGNTPALLKSGMQSSSFYAALWQTIQSGMAWRGIMIDRRKDGSLYTVDETITPLLNEKGLITHFIAIQQDMALRSQKQEQDHYLAYHDLLTGLPNRAQFYERLKHAIDDAERTKDMLALMFLDLDKFKPVNDTFGHNTGDQLIQAVGERLQAAVRKSDVVARIGGDEFAIILPGLLDKEIAIALASKVVSAISHPFVIADKRLQIGVSIGISIYPLDDEMQEELIRKADQAMYAAKQAGGSTFRFYG